MDYEHANGITIAQIVAAAEALERRAKAMRSIRANCADCTHSLRAMKPGAATCKLYNVDPPDDVKANGCESFVYDDIPF